MSSSHVFSLILILLFLMYITIQTFYSRIFKTFHSGRHHFHEGTQGLNQYSTSLVSAELSIQGLLSDQSRAAMR